MDKTLIGLLFILAGLLYGSLAIDDFYNWTLGWLVEHEWVKPPLPEKNGLKEILGRKPTILLYSGILIIIGLFILWNRNN
jgi:hypothetical protein